MATLAGLALTAGLVFVLTHNANRTEDPTLALGGEQSDNDEQVPLLPRPEPTDASEREIATDPASAPSVLPALHGRVVDEDGAGLAGVDVAWHVVDGFPSSDAEDAWGRTSLAVVHVETGPEGEFAFEQSPDTTGVRVDGPTTAFLLSQRSGLAVHITTLPTGSDGRSGIPTPTTIVMQERDDLAILVVDANGNAVEGAHVDHWAVSTTSDELAAFARRFHATSARTNGEGIARLPSIAGEQTVQARSEHAISATWRGSDADQVTLTLVEPFTLEGTLRLPQSIAFSGDAPRAARIVVDAQRGSIRRRVAQLFDVGEGAWGPITLARIDGASYSVTLEGAPLVSQTIPVPIPKIGERAHVDLVGVVGNLATFRVITPVGEPIANAEVEVRWSQDRIEVTRRERGVGDEPIRMWGLPAGTCIYSARAPGYAEHTGVAVVTNGVPLEQEIVLEPAGRIVGRCEFGGSPVRDFRVTVWIVDGPRGARVSREFLGRSDGSFEFEDAPLGDLAVVASSGEHPPSDPIVVRVTPETPARVTLSLPERILARGRVLDAATREPVTSAVVDAFPDIDSREAFGAPEAVAVDGTFVVSTLEKGQNWLRVSAPGYSADTRGLDVVPGDVLDLGDVLLDPARTFRLQLTAEDPDAEDFTSYAATILGSAGNWTGQRFSATGLLEIEDFSAGSYDVTITSPRSGWTSLVAHLGNVSDWSFEHRVSGPGYLHIEVVDGESRSRSEASGVIVSYMSSTGCFTRHGVGLESDGTVTIEGVDADTAKVDVLEGATWTTIAVCEASFDGEDEAWVSIPVDGEVLRVRVVDADGAALAGVQVIVTDDHPSLLRLAARTDAEGWAELVGIPDRPVLVRLTHAEIGVRAAATWGGGAGELELELDPRARIQLRLVDDAGPAPDLKASLRDLNDDALRSTYPSDATGLVSWSELHAGRFRVRAMGALHWPTTVYVEAQEAPEVLEVRLLRIGSLDLFVTDTDGVSLANATIELRCNALGEAVRDWVEVGLEERVVHWSGPETNDAGRLWVRDVPEGEYAWTVRTRDGREQAGSLYVHPSVTTTHVLLVPALEPEN